MSGAAPVTRSPSPPLCMFTAPSSHGRRASATSVEYTDADLTRVSFSTTAAFIHALRTSSPTSSITAIHIKYPNQDDLAQITAAIIETTWIKEALQYLQIGDPTRDNVYIKGFSVPEMPALREVTLIRLSALRVIDAGKTPKLARIIMHGCGTSPLSDVRVEVAPSLYRNAAPNLYFREEDLTGSVLTPASLELNAARIEELRVKGLQRAAP